MVSWLGITWVWAPTGHSEQGLARGRLAHQVLGLELEEPRQFTDGGWASGAAGLELGNHRPWNAGALDELALSEHALETDRPQRRGAIERGRSRHSLRQRTGRGQIADRWRGFGRRHVRSVRSMCP